MKACTTDLTRRAANTCTTSTETGCTRKVPHVPVLWTPYARGPQSRKIGSSSTRTLERISATTSRRRTRDPLRQHTPAKDVLRYATQLVKYLRFSAALRPSWAEFRAKPHTTAEPTTTTTVKVKRTLRLKLIRLTMIRVSRILPACPVRRPSQSTATRTTPGTS